MIANIAHQWRQPLSIISASATGVKVQKEMDLLTDTQLLCSMNSINDSAQHLSQTIEDFSTFFDPKENKKSDFIISNTIEKVLNLVSAQFNTKNIEIIKNTQDIKINSLENELIQALVNILNNARDVLLNIQETKKIIFINTFKKGNTLYIEIIDNGKGIPDNIIERVFEPYYTTKHKSQGTGIGLYMTELIVSKLLKGNISVCNEDYLHEDIDYKGAKFTITLDLL